VLLLTGFSILSDDLQMIENNLSREAKACAAARAENAFRFSPLIKSGRRFSGIDWDDRDALFERMEQRGLAPI
jgi:hypothetical protein